MLMDRDCLPCILNQVCRVLDHLHLSGDQSKRILRQALRQAAKLDFGHITAPEFSQKLYQVITSETGIGDPYKKLKKEQNRCLVDGLGFFKKSIAAARDPLRTAGVFALLGNIIDYGGRQILNTQEVFQDPKKVRLAADNYRQFRLKLKRARLMLYIADNAGEAVLDRLFMEEMRRFKSGLRIVYAVRSQPAINDVTAEDARSIGIDKVAAILPSGSILAGTLLGKTCDKFKQLFAAADVIVSKGQGNFETLEEEKKDVFFLFKVKCQAVARFLHLPEGALVFATREGISRAAAAKGGK